MKDHGERLSNISTLEPSQQISALITLVYELLEENKKLRIDNQQLKLENQLLKDEIAILKNQKPKPKIEPSKLEKAEQTEINDRKKNWKKGFVGFTLNALSKN